uniref:Uncharacterized protein n=1 Tax=Aegilops tauschii subsp. strangulata TaxID=200361 RepID=A0A453N0F3_AEGTS
MYGYFLAGLRQHWEFGMAVPHIDIKSVIAFTMFLKAFGGLLFITSSSFGAVVLGNG